MKQYGSNVLLCDSYSVTDTAGAIATSQSVQEVIVQADPDNNEDIFVGNDTNQTIQLLAGQSMTIPVDDISKIYAKTNQNTATLNYVGRGN
jgi:ABC-type molybdate transport system substrate-binding protein